MARGVDATHQQIFQFFWDSEELSFETELFSVVSSLGHLSIKSDRTNRLGFKIRQREGAGGREVATNSHGLFPYLFS